MILELGDGREVKLPDEMADETARQLKRLILGAEERARTAESDVRLLRDEMTAMRKHMEGVSAKAGDMSSVTDSLAAMHGTLRDGLAAIVKAHRADRILSEDSYGRAISKVA